MFRPYKNVVLLTDVFVCCNTSGWKTSNAELTPEHDSISGPVMEKFLKSALT